MLSLSLCCQIWVEMGWTLLINMPYCAIYAHMDFGHLADKISMRTGGLKHIFPLYCISSKPHYQLLKGTLTKKYKNSSNFVAF
jgi:hypothetical protein